MKEETNNSYINNEIQKLDARLILLESRLEFLQAMLTSLVRILEEKKVLLEKDVVENIVTILKEMQEINLLLQNSRGVVQ